MKIISLKVLATVLILILMTVAFAGCRSGAAEGVSEISDKSEDSLKGNVVLVGSTSVSPVATKLAEAFMVIEPGLKIDVQSVGSSAGVKAANDGAGDIGMASRKLKDKEKEWGVEGFPIAFDGIAIVVHPSNKVAALTSEQVNDIYQGQITNWSEVGGIDKEILVISREDGSGTRGAFEELMDLDGDDGSLVMEDAIFAEGNGAVKANVASKEHAIGYVSLSYLDESIQTVKMDSIEPSVENILAGEYKVSRPFLFVTKGEISKEAQAFIDFVLSEKGQEIVAEKLITVE